MLSVAVTFDIAVIVTAEYFGWRNFRGSCKPLQVKLGQKDFERLPRTYNTNKTLLREAHRSRREARKYQLPSSKFIERWLGHRSHVSSTYGKLHVSFILYALWRAQSQSFMHELLWLGRAARAVYSTSNSKIFHEQHIKRFIYGATNQEKLKAQAKKKLIRGLRRFLGNHSAPAFLVSSSSLFSLYAFLKRQMTSTKNIFNMIIWSRVWATWLGSVLERYVIFHGWLLNLFFILGEIVYSLGQSWYKDIFLPLICIMDFGVRA